MFVLVGVILLVASAMLAEAYKINKDDKFCDFLEHLPGSKKDCKHVLVGLVSVTILGADTGQKIELAQSLPCVHFKCEFYKIARFCTNSVNHRLCCIGCKAL